MFYKITTIKQQNICDILITFFSKLILIIFTGMLSKTSSERKTFKTSLNWGRQVRMYTKIKDDSNWCIFTAAHKKAFEANCCV